MCPVELAYDPEEPPTLTNGSGAYMAAANGTASGSLDESSPGASSAGLSWASSGDRYCVRTT